MIIKFLTVFKDYFIEVLPWFTVGLIISGVIHEFVPTAWIEKHLGRKGIKPILYSTFAGIILPICCLGSLPVAVSIHQKGARLGPVLAFLVATPATSVTALLVCLGLLGTKFTVFIFFAVILMGVVIGVVGNLIKFTPRDLSPQNFVKDPVCGTAINISNAIGTEYKGMAYNFCCPHCKTTFEKKPEKYSNKEYMKGMKERVSSIFSYIFIDMVKEIGPESLVGLAFAALIATLSPVGKFVGNYLSGGFGYLFSLCFGIIMYICSTASVPLVHAFISQGMNTGAGMVLLLVGPVTSLGTIFVLRKEFGLKTLAIYLSTIGGLALLLGYCFSII